MFSHTGPLRHELSCQRITKSLARSANESVSVIALSCCLPV